MIWLSCASRTGHPKRLLVAMAMILFTTFEPGWTSAKSPDPLQLKSVPLAGFQVTEGAIDVLPNGDLSVSSPKMRAVVPSAISPIAEVHFKYLGPTAGSSPLGSGEMCRQFGLKLRAQDPCNLLYVMWQADWTRRAANRQQPP
ncbi:MAG: hypothetical protein LAO21_15225 [Acidobacteriia bacterium]|nr:hypothetical protein [Terriglobia bacterium]